MLQVELDIFSGRPNPKWILTDKEEKQLLDRVTADPRAILAPSATDGRLGYRGYVVSTLSEGIDDGRKAAKLPSRFRIGGQPGSASDLNLWLLDTSEKLDSEVDDFVREVAAGMIVKDDLEPRRIDSATDKGALTGCASNYLTSSTNFSFWNTSPYIYYNNCYNFAANYRSNTFAQPGIQGGNPIGFPPTCANARAGAIADGWADSCHASNNLTIALVIWPGNDFHFYRLCINGRWCHKPGGTPAKNTDDSGNLIASPETANRGPYTTFCEYFYGGGGFVVVS